MTHLIIVNTLLLLPLLNYIYVCRDRDIKYYSINLFDDDVNNVIVVLSALQNIQR